MDKRLKVKTDVYKKEVKKHNLTQTIYTKRCN